MGVYLHAKFEDSSIILTSFRQGGNFTPLPPPPPPPQNKPLKSPPKLGLKGMSRLFRSNADCFEESCITDELLLTETIAELILCDFAKKLVTVVVGYLLDLIF